ncbi:MAG: class I SAM-dependent methyltransferase [Nocardioides sp.]
MDSELERFARSFGPVAEAYDRGRPSYPDEAVAWLVGREQPPRAGQGREPVVVLELGAGTGKLTERLVALGHAVHATDPDPDMLSVLQARLPGVRTSVDRAEELPFADASVDVVIAAQAFHWFDHDRALPEIARVLKPGGLIALVWNDRDERIPWVRRLGRLIGTGEQLSDPTEVLTGSGLFDEVEETTVKNWQDVNRQTIVDLVSSRSHVAVLEPAEREEKLRTVLALYDEYGRGMDGMQLPYVTTCFRARVRDPRLRVLDEAADASHAQVPAQDRGDARPGSDGGDADVLLIDFR